MRVQISMRSLVAVGAAATVTLAGLVVTGGPVQATQPAQAVQTAQAVHKWGTALAGEKSYLQVCRVRQDSPYGALWRVSVRGQNASGARPAMMRLQVVRNYWAGDIQDTVVASWERTVEPGTTTGQAHRYASILKDDAVRLHMRRPDGSGGLTWVVRPTQIPPCGMSPAKRHLDAGAFFQFCELMTTSGYGPLYKVWGRAHNHMDETLDMSAAIYRDRDFDNPIHRWQVRLQPGETSRIRVLYASILEGDELHVGAGNKNGGFGGDVGLDIVNIC